VTTSQATTQASEAAMAFIGLPTTKDYPKEKTISDQQDRKLQHTDEQKPVSELRVQRCVDSRAIKPMSHDHTGITPRIAGSFIGLPQLSAKRGKITSF
jgi:hypothetical protein